MDGAFKNPILREVMNRMQTELLRWYQETCDVVPKAYDNRFSEERMWGMVRNFVPPEEEMKVREFIRANNPGIAEVFQYAIRLITQQKG